MKRLFVIFFLCFGTCGFFAAEFDPSACPDTFYIDCGASSSGFCRSMNGGVTVLKYRVDSRLKVFPIYGKFYLKGLE